MAYAHPVRYSRGLGTWVAGSCAMHRMAGRLFAPLYPRARGALCILGERDNLTVSFATWFWKSSLIKAITEQVCYSPLNENSSLMDKDGIWSSAVHLDLELRIDWFHRIPRCLFLDFQCSKMTSFLSNRTGERSSVPEPDHQCYMTMHNLQSNVQTPAANYDPY